jgi:hypothetical protein
MPQLTAETVPQQIERLCHDNPSVLTSDFSILTSDFHVLTSAFRLPTFLSQLLNQADQRHEQRHDDEADGAAEDHDQQRFDQFR